MFWRDWINRAPQQFADIYSTNRETQRTVSEWMSVDVLDDSLWRYGIPTNHLLATLNQVDRNITYTDILSFLSVFLTRPRYLEIGVSSGKNFYQISKHLRDTILVGLDIEDINPVLAGLYSYHKGVWESAHTHPFTKHDGETVGRRFSSTEYYDPQTGNRVLYLSGNKFEREVWESLSGMSFNLVFSDACHNPVSLTTELDFLLQTGLVDSEEFIMIWDDVSDDLIPPVIHAAKVLSKHFPMSRPYAALVGIHGTYGGDSEGLHRIAVFVHDETLKPQINR